MAGLYIHIPFCHAKCAYCDFFSTPRRTNTDEYISALEQEFHRRKSSITEPFQTIYIGGGTPSILNLRQLDRIIKFIPSDGISEFTIEVNPEDVTAELAEYIAASPITRVSMGVQSLDDTELNTIGRRHTADDAVNAVSALANAGINNISLDLIYGLPGQTFDSWKRTLSRIFSLSPAHLSAYSLMYEPGTRLWAMKESGKIQESPQELSEAMYRELCSMALSQGFNHYEISNFAKPGLHSRHNSSYWNLTPYLGLGPGAHSFYGTCRYHNPNDIGKYISSNGNTAIAEHLTATQQANEYLLIRLRTRQGLSLDDYALRFGNRKLNRLLHDAKPHISSRRLILESERMSIPESMWLLTDTILVDLIDIDED